MDSLVGPPTRILPNTARSGRERSAPKVLYAAPAADCKAVDAHAKAFRPVAWQAFSMGRECWAEEFPNDAKALRQNKLTNFKVVGTLRVP